MTLPKNRGINKDRMRIDKNIPNYLTILRIVAIPQNTLEFKGFCGFDHILSECWWV